MIAPMRKSRFRRVIVAAGCPRSTGGGDRRRVALVWLLFLPAVLGCAAASPVQPDISAGDRCDAVDECVVLACEGEVEVCGIFSCGDVEPQAGPTFTPVQFRPPRAPPRPARSWRRVGLRADATPRAAVHFRYRYGYLPAFPRTSENLVKHHLFCQAPDLASWFKEQGIDIHAWTMLIPETVHKRIHGGGPRGGEWNRAWRDYRSRLRDDGRERTVTQEELFRQALKMAHQFDILGPIVPYRAGVPPPGPQLFAAPDDVLPPPQPEPPVLAQ